ncbi:uncharacterized protein LOC120011205 [Tripterygium wilfordii]|uniref:uncharacterized protein LOC120011205 n=1 Tax=Tripterygium wilfordii TaxID=458696 RepID=UPI0018F7F503|nr:uncharacterized protein LOC120011205 [Tripterygium wilfordii]
MLGRSIGTKEAKRDQTKNKNVSTGVIVTIYVEKSRFPSDNESNPIKKSKRPTTTTLGHDRRAQLLAYARELRNGGLQEAQKCPRMKSKPMPNRWKSKSRTILPTMSEQKKMRANYERISTEETVVVDQFCGHFNGKKKKGPKSVSQLCSKIKCALKELSCRPS